jgi:gas vesicle protein
MAEDNDSFWKGLFLGGAIGAVIALLYAPKSGRETREEISQKADKLYGKLREEYKHNLENAQQSIKTAEKRLEELSKMATDKTEKFSESISEMVEKGKEEIEGQKGRLTTAMDAAKKAYAQEKSTKKKKA